MKSKFLFLGITVGLIFLLIGCTDPKSDDNNQSKTEITDNDQPKTVTITDITGKTGYLSIGVYDKDGNIVAVGWPTEIKNNSASVQLTTIMNMPPSLWTGSGSYCIILGIGESTAITSNDETYFYTDGNPLPNSATMDEFFNELPKCNITQTETKILFNKFVFAE
jgi:hypothetical protein